MCHIKARKIQKTDVGGCLYGRMDFIWGCHRMICAALLRPHGFRNNKFSVTLHPLHCDCCLHCDVEAKMLNIVHSQLLLYCCLSAKFFLTLFVSFNLFHS